MSITVWVSEISCAYIWSTPLKEIYVWTTKVRPTAAYINALIIWWWWGWWSGCSASSNCCSFPWWWWWAWWVIQLNCYEIWAWSYPIVVWYWWSWASRSLYSWSNGGCSSFLWCIAYWGWGWGWWCPNNSYKACCWASGWWAWYCWWAWQSIYSWQWHSWWEKWCCIASCLSQWWWGWGFCWAGTRWCVNVSSYPQMYCTNTGLWWEWITIDIAWCQEPFAWWGWGSGNYYCCSTMWWGCCWWWTWLCMKDWTKRYNYTGAYINKNCICSYNCNADTCWSWWGSQERYSWKWWWWIVVVWYPTWSINASWWTVVTRNWYTIHCFTSNWTLTVN